MKAKATEFAPEAGMDVWKDETAFFSAGQSGAARSSFSSDQLAAYDAAFAAALPDAAHRKWIETGEGTPSLPSN